MASIQADVLEEICQKWNVPALKEHQVKALTTIVLEKRDTMICVPTGSGKSLCYEALTTVADRTASGTSGSDTPSHTVTDCHAHGIVLVVSPLVALITKQVSRLKNLGFNALNLCEKPADGHGLKPAVVEDLKLGKFRYIFGNPESFLEDGTMWSLLKTPLYKERVFALVFDEVHTAVAWGLSTDFKPAFRTYFSRVGDLRAHFSTAPMLCLTATASKTTQTKIKELLALKDPLVFELPPDRPNIRLYMNRVLPGPACLNWLVDLLQQSPASCPKTIIYCRTFKDCSTVYSHFLYSLGGQSDNLKERLFDMVHSKTSDNVKEHVIESLQHSGEMPRIVIATKVIGLGLDVNCETVVHYGPPTTMDDYIQQIGRAGRDGSQAHAIMLYSGKHLRNVDASVLELLKNVENKCLRTLCLKDFTNSEPAAFDQKHMCCSLCSRLCGCGSCPDCYNSYEIHVVTSCELEEEEDPDLQEGELFKRQVDAEDSAMLKVGLIELADDLDKEIRLSNVYVEPSLIHGLSATVVLTIMEQAPFVFSADDLIDRCGLGQYSTVVKIVELFSEIFTDMDTDVSVGEDML